ncbi:deoxyribonuclease IV [Oscillospiraceae bacterium LCP25S3_E10]|nr:deoxyribonuclease IV [Ruminococcus sp.]MDD6447611.1 deoxyribonuclease IV [Ruminococcus sp.]MDY2856329.1 deoxyribonuclease IV [Oscillospiraceae bacterium]
MLNIGCHLSASKGFLNMAKEAVSINANTFQFFTRNPRGFKAKDIDEKDINKFLEYISDKNFAPIVAHAPYTLNACSADEKIRELAKVTMADDLRRMEYVPNNYYNFHPGSHVKQGVEVGTDYIVEMLNSILTPQQTTTVLLETMAGKGSEIGRSFNELKDILDRVELKEKMGVCLDTCHIWDGGYNIVDDLDRVVDEFDSIIGLDKLYAIHLNDSKNVMNSHKDRHETIGNGHIGLEALARVINHPQLRNLPFELETPNDLQGYAKEIEILRQLYNE